MAPTPPATERAPLAGFGRRAAAMLLDGLIVFVAFVLIGAGLAAFGASTAIAAAVLYVLPLIYYPLGWSRHSEGQTFGKRGLDIEVVGADGEFISIWRSIGRFVAANISALALGLGFWWAIWDPQNRTWHDKIAGTWVRRVDYSPKLAPGRTTAVHPQRHDCPRCGESIAVAARICRFCGLELGEGWAT